MPGDRCRRLGRGDQRPRAGLRHPRRSDPAHPAICIKATGLISVSDLAAATGFNDTTVSQALRYLRATEVVTTERDGRVIRYRLTESPVADLLAHI